MATAAAFHPYLNRDHAVEGSQGDRVEQDDISAGVLVAIVRAGSRVDATTVEPFARELRNAIAAGAVGLLVDLKEAEEVTTAGMNALLAARQMMLERDGRIAIVLPQRLLHRFRVLQLDRRFRLARSRLEAAEVLGVVSREDRNQSPRSYAQAA